MNDTLKRLEASIAAGRTLHSYLLTGNDPDMTDNAARAAAALMLTGSRETARLRDDPDYMEYEGSVTIGEFREMIRPEIYRETYGKNGRVVVLLRADLLSPIVQNAMLKVLEEPPENTHFILTGNEYGILPTIRSRCMVIRCASQDVRLIEAELIGRGANEREAGSFAAYSGGVTARAIRLYEDQAFREMRNGAIEAFYKALRGVPEFKWTKQKRDKRDYMEANELLLLVCHDMMRAACGMEPEYCPDHAEDIKKSSSYFTIGQIGCIIDKLTENAARLSTNASGGAAFDRLFAGLAGMTLEIRSRRRNQQSIRRN